MKINKKSWHYQLQRNFGIRLEYCKISLCGYFWSTVFCLLICALLMVMIVPAIMVLSILPSSFFIVKEPSLINVSGFLHIYILSFLWYMYRFESEYYQVHREKKRSIKKNCPKKEPGLLISYIRARKEKICPLIEFEDE